MGEGALGNVHLSKELPLHPRAKLIEAELAERSSTLPASDGKNQVLEAADTLEERRDGGSLCCIATRGFDFLVQTGAGSLKAASISPDDHDTKAFSSGGVSRSPRQFQSPLRK
jgi:hypothetical protein